MKLSKIRLYPDTKHRAISFLNSLEAGYYSHLPRWVGKEAQLRRLSRSPWGTYVIAVPYQWVEYII